MRLFNQRQEYRKNLRKMQIIFDDEKTILYKYVVERKLELSKIVERIDIWFTNFINSGHAWELEQGCVLVRSLIQGLRKGIRLEDGELVATVKEIDKDKQ